MFSPAKRQRQENILIRLCDKFTRTEVNVICPVIKAEHSVRVLYKLQEKLLKDILQTAGDENGLSLQQVHCIPLPNSKGLQFNLFIEYASSTKTDTNNRQELRKTLDTKLSTVLRGTFTLIDELEDMDQIVPQPIISEVDFELHKLMSCANDLEKESEALPDLCIAAEAIYSMLEELKESYTKFAVLSQNGKGKSFILNLLLLMTADNNEEYLNNNRDIQLPEGFPNKVQWKKITESDSINLPDVVKDYIKDKDNNSLPPVCYPLECDKDKETALTSFNDIDRYFSESSRLDLEPYVLSQKEVAGSHQSTTKCILHLRYGTRYQMRVEYFNSKELQEQLFELFTIEEDSKHVNHDVKEKAEVCLRERYEILTGHEFTQEDSVNSFVDIKLSKDVLKFAGKTELYIGRGEDCTIDRLALQHVLKALTTSQEEDEDKAEEAQKKIAAVKEIVVYLPSKILHGGKEILEMPGTDDSDPIAMNFIRNALNEVDAVILVTEFGFTICEKEVKDMLYESGFLQRCDKDPSNNKIMLIAYPEKNSKWQFAKKGKNKIERLEVESKKKKDVELKTIAKILNKNSNDLEKNIFTTYLLPVLHSSILSQKDAQSEHEVISKHSDFLKYTGIIDFLIQLDEFVLSKQKSSFDHVKTRLNHFQRVLNNITKETARTIVLYLNNKEFQLQLNEKIQRLNDQLKLNMDEMLLGYVADLVEKMLLKNIPGAKTEWSAQKNNVTSVGVYSPYFCGKNPIYKVCLFHVIFGGLEVTKKELFDKILEQIDKILEEFKSDVLKVCITELNAFLKPKRIHVPENFVLQAINNKLLDVQQGYMGKKKLPFNVKTLEKMMTESQKESLKSVLLEKNFRKCDLEHAKSRTTANIEECIMRVKDPFMKKLLKLHEQRLKSLRTQLWYPNKSSKIYKELELEIKKMSRDETVDTLEQVIERLNMLMSASFN